MKHTLAAIAIAACALAAALPTASAQTPTPEPTLESTPTPAPGTYIDIEVVHDLNKDGIRQPDEPGVEGAALHGGCSDALIGIEPTDSEGKTRLLYVSSFEGRAVGCVNLGRRFGWLSTTPPFVEFDFPEGEQHSVVFLVHDLNPDVMEVIGEPILAGLPAWDATIALSAPYGGCIERSTGAIFPLLFIVGAARSGCPAPGAQVQLLLDGSPAGTVTYAAGSTLAQDPVARGDSMRMYGSYISGATIEGVECGVVQKIDVAMSPPGAMQIFVLSREVRPGCGTPGALVRFYRDAAPLDPLVPWRAGDFEYPDVPEFVPAQVIVSPNTGGGAPHQAPSSTLVLATALTATGLAVMAIEAKRRIRRRTDRIRSRC